MTQSLRVAMVFDLDWPQKRHAGIFAGTQRYATEQGWISVIDEYAGETLRSINNRGSLPFDGVIGRANLKLAERAQALRLPVVNIWFSSPALRQLPGVFSDFAAGGRLRAEHFLGRGLRNFATLGREDHGSKIEAASFREVVREAGFPCAGIWLALNPARNFQAWTKALQEIDTFMNTWQPPVGVFICTESVGRMVAQMSQARGWRVPQDVAIIAGSNEETLCEQPSPSLSSLERGHDRIGYEAARLLDDLMRTGVKRSKAKKTAPPQHIYLPPQGLVVRESTDFYAVQDEVVVAALAFISANCSRPIGQDDVSRAVNMETRTLQNRFRAVLDQPIVATIRRLRMERAKRELVNSDRTMKEIAREVGFGVSARMKDAFRRELGITPSEYRRARKRADESSAPL